MDISPRPTQAPARNLSLLLFELIVIVPVVATLPLLSVARPEDFKPLLLLWATIVAAVEFLPVPSWRGIQISTGFPLMMAVAFLYSPVAASVCAFVSACDPREFRREVTLVKALFNRSQIAVSVLLASFVFHSVATIDSKVVLVLSAAALATVADYILNVALVTAFVSLMYHLPPIEVLKRMRIGQLGEFVVSYLGLGLVGVVLAQLYQGVGFWAVAAFLTPVLFARQLFFRSKALEEAHKELQAREQVLEQLSNRMAEERQDERAQIAAYLHDDLAQMIFRLSLQVDIAKRHLRTATPDEVANDLEAIRETKNRTNELVRALIRDLHRSPLGRAGLAEALKSFTSDVGGPSGTDFHIDVADLPLPPPIQLLVYHISREAVMNALKHAGAANIWIALQPLEDVVQLAIRDDGVGFDAEGPGPEGHFGMTMMRERAQVAGGTFKVESVAGQGTTITVTFPTSWLDEENAQEQADQDDRPASLTEPPPTKTKNPKSELVRPREASDRSGSTVPA